MRTVFLTTAALLIICLISTNVNAQANGVGYSGGSNHSAYGAPPCGAPAYCGPLVPGCCEYPPSCRCDDIWAGYCQEKQNGGCWPMIGMPCFGGCHQRFLQPCSKVAQPLCTEPTREPTTVTPAPKSTTPAPTAPMPTPTTLNPPEKPLPDILVKPVSTAFYTGGGWKFLPAGSTVQR
jgi:hypothetical protein